MRQNWFFKYKIYHIPFWIAYHLLWLLINLGSIDASVAYLFGGELPVKFIGYIIFEAAGAYFNLYVLMPRYLHRGKYWHYVISVTVTIFLCTGLITAGYFLNAYWSDLSFEQLFSKRPSEWFDIFSKAAFPSTVASMTLAMSLKLAKNWVNAEKNRLLLEKAQAETELKYLKSQINPHFLFNVINSIFVLIHKNPDLASESLSSFSEMMRYQLYECDAPRVTLHKELDFLENFIELESLRLNEHQTDLQFVIDRRSTQNCVIAPFMLLPFVENAFKHISKGKTQKNFIHLSLLVADHNTLLLNLENSKPGQTSLDTPGIGLKNVQRRLQLIYPDHHQLDIKSDTNTFSISLKLELT